MSKVIKQMQMNSLKDTFKDVRDMVVMSVVGLDAITDNKVRLDLRKKGIRLQVVKNSLARKVFGELGYKIDSVWSGATTLAWGGSSIAGLSKEIESFAKKHEKFVKVKAAVSDGQEVAFDIALKMPTREEALGRIVAAMLAPAAKISGALRGPAGKVAGQIKTISEKTEEPAAS
jgi:large subunit ribosomal protein L10